MPITVTATPGAVDANSYGTLEEAESYVAANPDKNPTIEKHNQGLANAFGGIKGMGSL